MKKFIIIICILAVGFAGGFYLSRSPLFNSFVDHIHVPPNSAQTATDISDKPSDNNSTSITKDEAAAIALHDADINPVSIYNMRSHLDNYYGTDIYDVRFDTEDKQYNYNINKKNGDILAMDYEVDERYLRNMPDNPVSEQEAVNLVARNIQGVHPNDIRLHHDYDDNYLEYDGIVIVDNIRYEFTINADKGIITEWDVDYMAR